MENILLVKLNYLVSKPHRRAFMQRRQEVELLCVDCKQYNQSGLIPVNQKWVITVKGVVI